MAQEGPAGLHAVQHAGREAAAEQEERVDPTGSGGGNPIDSPIPLESCDWLNITACNATGGAGGCHRTQQGWQAAAGWRCHSCLLWCRLPGGCMLLRCTRYILF